jgi:hypothetical protein
VKVRQEDSAEQTCEETDLAECEVDTKWKAAIALLVTIPCIGLLTACWLVVAILNITLGETAEAAVHYVGLAPLSVVAEQVFGVGPRLVIVGTCVPERSCIWRRWQPYVLIPSSNSIIGCLQQASL